MKKTDNTPKKVLSVGGWDPCGAFGVAADIKTVASLDCHGMAALTVATVQNSVSWGDAQFLSASMLERQLDAVLSDYGADAIKTGFLGRVDLIESLAKKIKAYDLRRVVVDPVLVNAKAEPMFAAEVKAAYEDYLFPLATVLTPNLKELSYLLFSTTEPWLESSENKDRLRAYHKKYFPEKAVIVLKGLTKASDLESFSDAWYDAKSFNYINKNYVDTKNLSGSGDTFSAAVAAYLAQDIDVEDAILEASRFTQAAIERSASWQLASASGPIANFYVLKSNGKTP